MFKKFNTEKKTKLILGIFYLILALFFSITVWGLKDMARYVLPTVGLTMGLILISEGGIAQFFSRATYKKISGKEVLNLATVITGGGLVALAIAMFGLFPSSFSIALLKTFGATAGIIALAGGIFSFIHFFINSK